MSRMLKKMGRTKRRIAMNANSEDGDEDDTD
jgi:hypothetical protein